MLPKAARRALTQAPHAAMVGVAQLAERQVVVLDVEGSSPFAHPKRYPRSETWTSMLASVSLRSPDPVWEQIGSGPGSAQGSASRVRMLQGGHHE